MLKKVVMITLILGAPVALSSCTLTDTACLLSAFGGGSGPCQAAS